MSTASPAAALQPLKNSKHEAVLQAWIADPERVWWRAWQHVYPKSQQRAAEVSASRLLKGAEFCARRDALLQQIAAAVMSAKVMDLTEVLEELSKLGRSDIRNCLVRGDESADLVESIEDLAPEHSACIQELTVETYVEGGGEDSKTVKRVKVKLHDKRGALNELRRHFEPQRHSDPDGRPLGTGAAERAAELSPLELARRIAFALEVGVRHDGAMTLAAGAPAIEGKAEPTPATKET